MSGQTYRTDSHIFFIHSNTLIRNIDAAVYACPPLYGTGVYSDERECSKKTDKRFQRDSFLRQRLIRGEVRVTLCASSFAIQSLFQGRSEFNGSGNVLKRLRATAATD